MYPNLFKTRYHDLHGKDWLRRIDADDRQAFSHIGRQCADHGRLGGIARAHSAYRDERGKFFSMRKSLARVYAWQDDYPPARGLMAAIFGDAGRLASTKGHLLAVHTMACLRADARQGLIRGVWLANWPNHCTKCEGWGGFWYPFDPSPAGVALSPGVMEDFDVCPQCVECGCCPRCGEQIFPSQTAEVEQCPFCDFDFEHPEGCPPANECYCWENTRDQF